MVAVIISFLLVFSFSASFKGVSVFVFGSESLIEKFVCIRDFMLEKVEAMAYRWKLVVLSEQNLYGCIIKNIIQSPN